MATAPSLDLSNCHSEPDFFNVELTRSKRKTIQPLRRRAAEIVKLNGYIAHSSTGLLQHSLLPRLREATEQADELLIEQGLQHPDGPVTEEKRDRQWARQKMSSGAELHKQKKAAEAPKAENKWVLRRGTWFYQGGPPEIDPTMTADEALDRFIKEEEARGRGPQYRNGIARGPGNMRGWQVRNSTGGFFTVV
mmetsp:Transcript_49484/g.146169  ORF Transcript_49484/g.146169 Transcript_49484/m.146169 type:complete len:193 (-) Transcript_49484:42-620(-)